MFLLLIEVQGLTKKYKDKVVLRDINFTFTEPCIVGLLGANGAGKSTLMRILTGLTNKTQGNVKLLDKDPWSNWDNIYSQIGVLFEPKIPKYLNNVEYLKQICILRNIKFQKIEETLELIGLEPSKKKVKSYSFGMLQRLGLAGALITGSKILILDEPFVGLDPIGIKDLQNTLKELATNGVLIFISSHQLVELEEIVNRIIFLEQGEIKFDGSAENFKSDTVKVFTSDNQEVLQLITKLGYSTRLNNNYIEVNIPNDEDSLNNIIACVNKAGATLLQIDKSERGLDTLFR